MDDLFQGMPIYSKDAVNDKAARLCEEAIAVDNFQPLHAVDNAGISRDQQRHIILIEEEDIFYLAVVSVDEGAMGKALIIDSVHEFETDQAAVKFATDLEPLL